jgi:hypothetical protein
LTISASTLLEVEDHPASGAGIHQQLAGGCSTFDFRVNHLHRYLIDLQLPAGHEIVASQLVKRLVGRGRCLHPTSQSLARVFHSKMSEFLLHRV